MRLLGWELRRASATPIGSRGWWPWIREPFTGAWQRNMEWSADTVLAHHAVYSCITLISNDIGKLRWRLMQQRTDAVWEETSVAAFSPLLRRPNPIQNHIQFKQWWITSKLLRGNTYALKQRDNRNVVVRLYLLDPSRVQVLCAPDGSVFYQLSADNLSGIADAISVPASEIIHDRMNCLFHPLVGVSPLYAAGQAANVGLRIEENSTRFFGNGSNPSGVLTAPGSISDETAGRLKEFWQTNFGGENTGRVAILGDGLTFEPMRMTAVDSQLIEQLRWTAEVVCSCFHVPPFMAGVGAMPTYNNIEALGQQYYTQCLQSLIEEMEACLDEGLGLEEKVDGRQLGIELDLDGLLRMDTATLIKSLREAVAGSIQTINEARRSLGLPPVEGGDTVWMQQQNYSLDALAERDKNSPLLPQKANSAANADAPLSDDEMDQEMEAAE